MKSGIYQIKNLINGKIYIGSSYHINKRLVQHKSNLNCNRHQNPYLQSAWNKYKEENFEFTILTYCEKQKLIEQEQFWLDWTKCYERQIGYNLYKIAGSPEGYSPSKDTRVKISKALKGLVRSEKTKAKMSAWQIGRKMSNEAKKNMTLGKLNNQYRRDKNKWPHSKGHKCKCEECMNLKRKIKNDWYANRKQIVSKIIIVENAHV